MRIVIQRVKEASVLINHKEKRTIQSGLLVLVGAAKGDKEEDWTWLANKLVQMRIFPDAEGKMNLSLLDTQGDLMLISQFTLFASTKKGNRPSFNPSALPEEAIPAYERFVELCEEALGKAPQCGEFGAHMDVSLVNHGPVTIVMDSRNRE